jgi:hypothetical protein
MIATQKYNSSRHNAHSISKTSGSEMEDEDEDEEDDGDDYGDDD